MMGAQSSTPSATAVPSPDSRTKTLDVETANAEPASISGSKANYTSINQSGKRQITLQWSNIEYTVQDPESGSSKTLLQPMSGEARPGELLGIMGTSGAGKSTLLDILAGRLNSKDLKGILKTNGSPIDKASFRKESGYVMQNDALFPLLTVRETLKYAAYLRVPGMSKENKLAIVEQTIQLLRLEKAADTIIGDDLTRGLSGGEKRRVSIGVDIVHQPSVVFLDEPTSGLDSSTALSVIDSLKQLAIDNKTTIVMTIHQPSARLFSLLDNVIFLAAGNVTYNGPAAKLEAYTASIYKEANLGVPIVANPPEVFLELSDQLVQSGQLNLLASKFSGALDETASAKTAFGEEEEGVVGAYANSFVGETAILMQRALDNVLRTKELFFARVGACIGFGVMIGTLFLNTQQDILGLQHRLSYFVFTLAFFFYTSLEALPVFLAEREIFQREFSRGAYRAASYTVATTLVYVPFMFALAVVYTIVTWWLIGLGNDPQIVLFNMLTVLATLMAGNAFATMFSVLVPDPMTGQTAGSGLFSVMFLFSGFFIKKADIPDYWIWIHYLSLFKYAYDSLLVNGFEGRFEITKGYQPMTNEQVLEYLSVNGEKKGTGVIILFAFVIFFRIVFYHRLVTAFNGSRK